LLWLWLLLALDIILYTFKRSIFIMIISFTLLWLERLYSFAGRLWLWCRWFRIITTCAISYIILLTRYIAVLISLFRIVLVIIAVRNVCILALVGCGIFIIPRILTAYCLFSFCLLLITTMISLAWMSEAISFRRIGLTYLTMAVVIAVVLMFTATISITHSCSIWCLWWWWLLEDLSRFVLLFGSNLYEIRIIIVLCSIAIRA